MYYVCTREKMELFIYQFTMVNACTSIRIMGCIKSDSDPDPFGTGDLRLHYEDEHDYSFDDEGEVEDNINIPDFEDNLCMVEPPVLTVEEEENW